LKGVNLERSEVEAILGLNFDALLGSLPSMCLADENFAGETRDEGARGLGQRGFKAGEMGHSNWPDCKV